MSVYSQVHLRPLSNRLEDFQAQIETILIVGVFLQVAHGIDSFGTRLCWREDSEVIH